MGMEKSVWGGRRACWEARGSLASGVCREGGGESAKRRGSRGKCWASDATEREMWVGSRPLEFALPKPLMTVEKYGQGKAWRHCGLKKGLESWESCQKMGTMRKGAGPLCLAHESSSHEGRVDFENSPDVRTIDTLRGDAEVSKGQLRLGISISYSHPAA